MKLLNQSKTKYQFTLTKNPITNVRQSPAPMGLTVEELDPGDVDYLKKKNEILNHPYYSESEVVYCKPGINDYDNDEQAEYIYKTLGDPEVAEYIPVGAGRTEPLMNKNFVWEVDKDGNPVKGALFQKYRIQHGQQVHLTADPSQFKVQE